MKLEEVLVKCDKCVACQENERQQQKQQQQQQNQDDESGKVPSSEESASSEEEEEMLNSEEDSQLESTTSNSGSVRSAVAKCVECDLRLCDNCILDHQIQNETSQHKLIPLLPSELSGESLTSSKSGAAASAFSILNSTRGLDDQQPGGGATVAAAISAVAGDSSPIIEKKRDCHASEFLNEAFLKVSSDESYQEGLLIKRRDSNIDKSSIENKMTPPATANQTANNEEDKDLSSSIVDHAQQSMMPSHHHHHFGHRDNESKIDSGSIVDFLNEFGGDLSKLKLHAEQQSSFQQQQQQLPTNQLIQQQLLLKLKQQEQAGRFQYGQQQQQQQQQGAIGSNSNNNRLSQIEAEISKTFSFYVQVLKERKEYLVKELNTIVQFAVLNHSQNINKQVQVQYQLELKKQQLEKELNDCYDMLNEQANGVTSTSSSTSNVVSIDEASVKSKLNLLNELNNLISMNNQLIAQLKSTNPLSSIEFISNYSAIQTSIRNTFGLIRINQQGGGSSSSSSSSGVSMSNSSTSIGQGSSGYNGGNKNYGFGGVHSHHHAMGQLSINCDKTLTSSSQHSLLSGQSSSGVSATTSSSSLLPSNSTTSMFSSASSAAVNQDLITSPVSTMNKKHASTSSLPSFSAQEQWKSSHLGDYMLAGNELMMDQGVNGDHEEIMKLKSSYGETFEQSHAIRENPMITLSAGSTSSSKSNKSNSSSSSSSSSSKFSPTTTVSQGAAVGGGSTGNNYGYDSGNLYMQQQQQQQQQAAMSHHSSSSFGHHSSQYKPHLMPAHGGPGHNQFSHQGGPSSSSSSSHPFGRLYSLYDLTLKNSLQLTRSKMIYHCKFGEFGINDGQFTEPSGVTINTNNDIIVADTNSHRIQIFDREGNFKFKFGECGKRDGQLLYPNRVSIVKQTGDIVVTERSPTHQIQIYNKYGQFLRKFGANILQHPRGVFVDHKGRIVVVECKVMRVIIFDLFGNVLNKFNCSKYLEFPNGVCCSNPNATNNYREEIYISDNRAHCIKVFDYNGNFLRQIGGEGITNYPIGVGINSNNEILVADNHNNFNLTVFTQDGKLINALESKVKHAQCFDVGLMDDGSIVLASKDYRIYVYKYSTGEGIASPIVTSPTHHAISASASASSCSMNANAAAAAAAALFPSASSTSIGGGHHHHQHHHQVSKYELFSDCNNNSTPAAVGGIQHSPGGLYNYFKPSVSDSLSNNITGLFSELSASSNTHGATFHTASHLESNFFADSAAAAALSAAAAHNNNNNHDMSHNESTSVLNLSTNTTTTNNLVSILNGIL